MTCKMGDPGMPGKHLSTVLAIVSFLVCAVTAPYLSAQQQKVNIGDKTLLAWVQLANLEQRGKRANSPGPS